MSLTEHIGAQLARYCQIHNLEPASADELLLLPIEAKHKAWLERHLARAGAAEILEPYGFELEALGKAERAKLAFDGAGRIMAISRSGNILPGVDDWHV